MTTCYISCHKGERDSILFSNKCVSCQFLCFVFSLILEEYSF